MCAHRAVGTPIFHGVESGSLSFKGGQGVAGVFPDAAADIQARRRQLIVQEPFVVFLGQTAGTIYGRLHAGEALAVCMVIVPVQNRYVGLVFHDVEKVRRIFKAMQAVCVTHGKMGHHKNIFSPGNVPAFQQRFQGVQFLLWKASAGFPDEWIRLGAVQ